MNTTTRIKHFSSPESEEMIASFIATHPQGVISTIEMRGTVQSSVVNIYQLHNFHLAFMTKRTTRKFKNLQSNPTISFMTYDPFSRTEVEIEGIAQLVHDKAQESEILDIMKEDSKKGRWHVSPYVSEEDDSALFIIYPKKAHMTTYWDKASGIEVFHESLEFDVKMRS